MFNLNETITAFNRIYDTKIKPNKTWGLVYLQPQSLAFLNQNMQLIQESVYYASPFVTDRKALRAFARTKEPSLSESLPTLQNITQQLKADQSILQRLSWEENLSERLNNKDFWEERFNQADTHPRIQGYLMQLQAQWNTHQPFQYHSSQGLFFYCVLFVNINIILHGHTRSYRKSKPLGLLFFAFLMLSLKGISYF